MLASLNYPTAQPGVYGKMPSMAVDEPLSIGFSMPQKRSMISPEELSRAYQGIEQGIPDIRAQRQGIQQLEGQIQAERGAPVDVLSGPLAGLLQSEFGRQVSAQPHGESPEDQRDRIFNYISKTQTAKSQLSQRIADLIGKEKTTDRTPPTNPNVIPPAAKAVRDVQGKFNKSVEPFAKSINFANEVDSLLDNPGPGGRLAKKTVETILARARGEVGNLSQYEQQDTATARSLLDRLQQSVSTVSEGTFSERNKQAILDLTRQYKEAAKAAISTHRQLHAAQGAGAYSGMGLTEPVFEKLLPSVDSYAPASKVKSVPSDSVEVVSPSGQHGRIPRAQLEQAMQHGYKEAPGA